MEQVKTKTIDQLPDTLLEDILIRLDIKTLQSSGCKVSVKWRQTLNSKLFWKRFLKYYNVQIPRDVLYSNVFSWSFYKSLATSYLLNGEIPYDRNLLKNASGEMEEDPKVLEQGNRNSEDFDEHWFKHWYIWSSSGQGWRLYREENGTSYFATSNISCTKQQTILLENIGLPLQMLELYQPEIVFEEMYSKHFGHGCTYEVTFELHDASDKNVVDPYTYRVNMTPDEDDSWRTVRYVFKNYGGGVRKLKLYHGGFAEDMEDGWWGTKITGSKVIIKFPDPKNVENAK